MIHKSPGFTLADVMDHDPAIRHLLLDIEGTTCPVNFVSDVLFPYARQQLLPYLKRNHSKASIRSLLAEVHAAWKNDRSPEAITLAKGLNREGHDSESVQPQDLSPEEACIYLNWLIKHDRKVTVLKDLQGWIWEEGYLKNELIAPLFTDVPAALKRWHEKGMELAVYSSGSVQAQKLLYAHTNAGDLSPLFSHWFDTHTGAKTEPQSYTTIATLLHAKPGEIVFISDSPAELAAARSAQMISIFSYRPGNPHLQAEGYPKIETFADLHI
jgi:enolase-phosphatase E1